MIGRDGNEMMSIHTGVCRIYTPHHVVYLSQTSMSVHAPWLSKDVLRGCDRASLEMHLEAMKI